MEMILDRLKILERKLSERIPFRSVNNALMDKRAALIAKPLTLPEAPVSPEAAPQETTTVAPVSPVAPPQDPPIDLLNLFTKSD